jgi:hypothetical protein
MIKFFLCWTYAIFIIKKHLIGHAPSVCARARAGLLITVEMSEICRTSGGESEVCDIFESDGLINIYI